MIIWNSLKLFPHIHGYLFIFANTEIYVIMYKKLKNCQDETQDDVFVIKGFTVFQGKLVPKLTLGTFLTLSVRNVPNLQSYLFQVYISLNSNRGEQNYTIYL